MQPRIKIDVNTSSYNPFAVFVRRARWWNSDRWEKLETFKALEEARAFADSIKNLPEYM